MTAMFYEIFTCEVGFRFVLFSAFTLIFINEHKTGVVILFQTYSAFVVFPIIIPQQI